MKKSKSPLSLSRRVVRVLQAPELALGGARVPPFTSAILTNPDLTDECQSYDPNCGAQRTRPVSECSC
jgi:hypothetical protein